MRISDWSSDVCSSDLILSSARRATHVVTPSKAMLDSLLLWAPEIADKCSVNRYGTVPAFRGGRTRQWRADGTLRLLYVSVYYAHKNPAVVCAAADRSEEHTSELQSLMRISYAVFCLKKKTKNTKLRTTDITTHIYH